MRPARTLFLLVLILSFGCGGVQIILKPPIQQQCGTAHLKGCPQLTDGVLLYVQGDKVKGKDALIKGAAQNAPSKLKKFAQALRELEKIPGASAYMKQVLEVADIIATAPGGPERSARRRRPGAGTVDLETRYAAGDIAGDADGGEVAPAMDPARGSCGGLPGYAYCVWAATGPLVVTELNASPGCPVEMVVGAARTAQTIDTPRWVARNPHGLTRTFVRDGESLFIGVQAANADPRCAVFWSGIYPDDY